MKDPLSSEKARVSRRMFFGAAAGATAAAAQAPQTSIDDQRQHQAFRIRVDTAILQRDATQPNHPTNGDEERLPRRSGVTQKVFPTTASVKLM
jgi:hypothetical protein